MRVRTLVASSLVATAACGGSARTPTASPTAAVALDNSTDDSEDVPIDNAEALTQWRNTGVTGASFQQQLDAIPDDLELRRAMALALLRGGSLVCEDVVEQYMCGDSYFEFAPLAPTATFDDPCLRRQLALWSLQQLDGADAAELTDVLVELVSLRAPETELQPAAFALLASDDDVMRLALIRHAEEPLAESEAALLESSQARVFAARDLHLDSAFALLEPDRHHATMVAGLNDEALSSDTRSALITQLAADGKADTEAALIDLTSDTDCALAMLAAETLVARDRAHARHLPSRPTSADAADHMQALCMLQHDSNDTRREARLHTWFGADGLSVISESYDDYHDDSDPDADEEGDADEEEGEADPWATTVERDGSHTTTTERIRPGEIITETVTTAISSGYSCTGLTCSIGDTTITFTDAPDGSLHLESVATIAYNGCGC